jgi:Family of unknown function (DUF6364)
MQTKLTLRLDEQLIVQAKAYAAGEGRSLSELVSVYFSRLSADPSQAVNAEEKSVLRTSSLRGLLAGKGFNESDYALHLEQKYK